MARLSQLDMGGYLRRHKPDYGIVLLSGMLLLFGLVVMFAVSPALSQRLSEEGLSDNHFFYRQGIFILAGAVAFWISAILPLKWWRTIQPLLIAAGLASSLLLLIPGVGTEFNGAVRWIDLGFFTFQPAELLKLALILYMASFLAEKIRLNKLNDRNETLLPLLIILAILSVVVLILQRDLGTMVALTAIIFTMLYTSGMKFSPLSKLISIVAAGAVAAVVLFPHRLSRLLTFVNPESDVEGTGYHINQALIAIGSGGMWGKGLGRSVQVFGYLPEAANDSIFAIIAEKFGFVGSVLVIMLYGALFWRLLKLIDRAPNDYFKLLVAGVFGWIVSHTIINIGAMLGLLPLTGITLPLLSLGGTSMVLIMAALGLVFNISRYSDLTAQSHKRGGSSRASTRHRGRNRRTRHTASGYSF
ncbi:MAG: putative peptidoglycan glycosyltransferase FtsW [Candidatus Saccharimonadales bacterium]|nr:putative peptidoglycan glycosyltransferase FtsW [Candidatus Saccharimonadales bacterium]